MPPFFNLGTSGRKQLLWLGRGDKLLLNAVHLLCPERDMSSAFRDGQCSRTFCLHVFLRTQCTCFARFFLYLPIPSLFTYLNISFFLCDCSEALFGVQTSIREKYFLIKCRHLLASTFVACPCTCECVIAHCGLPVYIFQLHSYAYVILGRRVLVIPG